MALPPRCATYVLVEPDRLKIGHSSAVARRAREIAPFVDWDLSLAAIFSSVQEATDCERALHWIFRRYRLKGVRGSGTEYFMRDCLPQLDAFLSGEHGSGEIKRGEKLRQWFEPGTDAAEREYRRQMDSFFAKLSRDPRRGEVFWWLYDAYDGIMQRTRGRRMSWHVLLNELQENGLTNSEGNPVTNVNSLRRTFERVRALKKRDAEWLARQEAERSK